MIRIERPAVQANVGAISTRLDKLLTGVVTALAQALKRAEPKFVDVASVRLNMIADLGRGYYAALQAEAAERMPEQLELPDPSPARRAILGVPHRGSTAGSHGSYHPSSERRSGRINVTERMSSTRSWRRAAQHVVTYNFDAPFAIAEWVLPKFRRHTRK